MVSQMNVGDHIMYACEGYLAGPGCAADATSTIHAICHVYGFAPDIVAAGTDYFKRLAAANFLVNADATADLQIEAMLPQSAIRPVAAVHAYYLQAEAWLTLVHLTCIYLAAKYIDFVPCRNMLQTMMGHIYGIPLVDKSYVVRLELDCLDALKWQLGTETYGQLDGTFDPVEA